MLLAAGVPDSFPNRKGAMAHCNDLLVVALILKHALQLMPSKGVPDRPTTALRQPACMTDWLTCYRACVREPWVRACALGSEASARGAKGARGAPRRTALDRYVTTVSRLIRRWERTARLVILRLGRRRRRRPARTLAQPAYCTERRRRRRQQHLLLRQLLYQRIGRIR